MKSSIQKALLDLGDKDTNISDQEIEVIYSIVEALKSDQDSFRSYMYVLCKSDDS